MSRRSHTWIKPVADIDCTIRPHGDIAGPEKAGSNLFDVRVFRPPAYEVCSIILFFGIGCEEVEPVELKGALGGARVISKDGIKSGVTTKEGAIPLLTQGAIFVKGDARGSTSSVDVSRIHRARVVLPPVNPGVGLTRSAHRLVPLFAIPCKIPCASIFKSEGGAASPGVIVIILEHVSERGQDLLVGITKPMADDLSLGAVGVHPNGKTRDPHMTVPRGFPGGGKVVRRPVWTPAAIGATEVECFTGLVSEDCSAVPIVEVELSSGTSHQRVKPMIMIDSVESSENDLPFVDRWIKSQVPVHIGIGEEIWRLRDVDDIVEDRYSKGRDKACFLHESVRVVTLPISVRILENDDPVTSGPLALVSTVVHSFGDPYPTLMVDIHVGWVVKLRSGGPDGYFKRRVHLEHLGRKGSGGISRPPLVLCRQ